MRYLRDCEKKNIYEMDKLVWLFIKYLNSIVKNIFLVLILDTLFFYVLYKQQFEIKKIIIILSIFSIVLIGLLMCMYLLCKVFRDIENDKIWCEDVALIKKREEIGKVKNEPNYYFVTINIEKEDKEIKYDGNNFDSLKEGDKMVLIEYSMFNKKEYMCFSYNEINKI